MKRSAPIAFAFVLLLGTGAAFAQSTGACCLSDEECVETTPEECTQLVGLFKGEGTLCTEDCPSKVSTGFSYTGQVKQDGLPYSGPLHAEFTLWDLPNNGELVAGPVTLHNIVASNGLFRTIIDFGDGGFGSSSRWLEVGLCTQECENPEAFAVLSPRQLVTAVPFALQTRGIAVDDQGNVGIHTANPGQELDVGGVVRAKEVHMANPDGVPVARWDGSRFEPGPTEMVSGTPPASVVPLSGMPVWSSPSSVILSDDVRATLLLNQANRGPSQALRITGFNLNLPADAIVTVVQVSVEGSKTESCSGCTGEYAQYYTHVPLRLVSGVQSGPLTSAYIPGAVEVNSAIGLGSWTFPGWTPAMFNAPDFGVEIQGELALWTTCYFCGWYVDSCQCECLDCQGTGSISVDAITVSVFYHHDVVVNKQWSMGLGGSDARFQIAPTANLSSPLITLLTTGQVGLGGVTQPFYGLELNSNNGWIRASGVITSSSKRWKENIERIPDALEKLLRMEGVTFDWVPEYGGQHDIGFVAEDVAKVVPELVSLESDGQNARGMKYDRVTALAVEAIKELNTQLRTREEELRQLRVQTETQINELKSRLERLESGGNPVAPRH